jgi:hypothetical protein
MASVLDSFPCPSRIKLANMLLPGRTAYIHRWHQSSTPHDHVGCLGLSRRRRESLGITLPLHRSWESWHTAVDKQKLTFVDLHVWPDILSLTNHSSLPPIQASLDRNGNLNGVRVRNTEIKELSGGDPING